MSNNINHKHLIGGLNISVDNNTNLHDSNYFTDNIVLGVKSENDFTALEIDSSLGITNIPKLNHYVNAYTLTYVTNNTNNESSTNFVHSYSTYIYPNVDGLYKSYHVAITAYTLPTKHYVDKLIELKDALIYRGTMTPSDDRNGNFTFQPTGNVNTEEGAMLTAYTTAGSVYKVDKTGYFGETLVHAGDMIISYSDETLSTNTTGWNIIEMHISHDNASSKKINVETGATNRLLTNAYIDHTGKLSYTYIHLLENQVARPTSVSESNRQYVEYVDIEHNPATNDIYVSYHTKVLKFNNTGVHDPGTNSGVIDTFGDSTYRFITNVFQNIDGHLSYTYVDVKTYSHHNTYCLNEVISTTENPKFIINSVYLDDNGGFTYTYRDATILASDIKHANSLDKDISTIHTTSDGVKVITGITATSDGQISYAYSKLYSTHGTSAGVDNGDIDLANNTINVMTGAYLNDRGILSYTYTTLTKPSMNANNVIVSLFKGDNNVTYMMTTNGGKIEITQPIKSMSGKCVYTGPNANTPTCGTTPVYMGESCTYDFTGYALTIKSNHLYVYVNGAVNQFGVSKITYIGANGNTEYLYSSGKYTYTADTSTQCIDITLDNSIGLSLLTSTPKGTLSASNTLNESNSITDVSVTGSSSASAKKYEIFLTIGTSELSDITTIPAIGITKTYSGTSKYALYYSLDGGTTITKLANPNSSLPSSITLNAGKLVLYWPTSLNKRPKLYQLNALDASWVIDTTNISLSSNGTSTKPNSNDTGTAPKVNYIKAVYQKTTSAAGTWSITWVTA